MVALHEQWDNSDGDLSCLGDWFCCWCLLGMVYPPLKFAGVVCWDINHVKFSCLVKFSFEHLFSMDWELWCGWLECSGLVSLEQNRKISLAELVHRKEWCADVAMFVHLLADGWDVLQCQLISG